MKPLICSLFLLLAAPMFVLGAAQPARAAAPPLLVHLPAQEEPNVSAQIAAVKAGPEPSHSTFNGDEGLWDTESNEDVVRTFGPGVYQIRIETPNTLGWGTSPHTAADFYAEVETYHVGGSINNEFGFVFRNDGENYYVFGVSNDGYFRLQKWLDGEWQSLLPWAESSAIVTGEGSHNTLALLADGPRLSLLVNGQVLATVTDDSIAGDGLALAVSSFEETGVEIAFEDFRLWTFGAGDGATRTEENQPPDEAAEGTPEGTPEVAPGGAPEETGAPEGLRTSLLMGQRRGLQRSLPRSLRRAPQKTQAQQRELRRVTNPLRRSRPNRCRCPTLSCCRRLWSRSGAMCRTFPTTSAEPTNAGRRWRPTRAPSALPAAA